MILNYTEANTCFTIPTFNIVYDFESDPSFYFILYRHISFFLVWPLCMTLNLIFLFTLFYMGIFFGIRP